MDSFYRRSDILISSYGHSLEILDEKFSLLHSLWKLNLSADLSFESHSVSNELMNATNQGYLFLIIVKSRMDHKIYFKLKNLISRNEFELSKSEILSFITSEWNDLTRMDKHKRLESVGMDLSTIKSPAKDSFLKEMVYLEPLKKGKSRSFSTKSQLLERG